MDKFGKKDVVGIILGSIAMVGTTFVGSSFLDWEIGSRTLVYLAAGIAFAGVLLIFTVTRYVLGFAAIGFVLGYISGNNEILLIAIVVVESILALRVFVIAGYYRRYGHIYNLWEARVVRKIRRQ